MEDFKKIMDPKNPIEWCDVELIDDDIRNWIAYIYGPPGTGYEGGTFKVYVNFHGSYESAQITMETTIFHMNMEDGDVCLKMNSDPDVYDARRDGGSIVLQEIYDLMKNPQPLCAIDMDAIALYLLDAKQYIACTKMFSDKYAWKSEFKKKKEKEKEKEKNNDNNGNNNDEKKDDGDDVNGDSKKNT